MTVSICINARAYRDSYGRLDEQIHTLIELKDGPGLAGRDANVAFLSNIKGAVDDAWEAAVGAIREHHLDADVSDAAEELVGALYRYLLLSNPEVQWGVPA